MKKSKLLNVYKILALAFVIMLLVLPKAVLRTPEIEAKLLITTLGIDREREKIIASGTAVMPSESHDGSTKRLSVSAEGESLSEALERLSVKMGKKLELGLCGLVIVGNTLEKENVLPYLEYLLSSGKIIPGAYVAYSPDRSAKEAIEMTNSLSEATSNGISKLIEHNANLTNVTAVTLHKFLSNSHGPSEASFMLCLRVREKQSSSSPGGSSQGGGGSSQGSSSQGGGGSSQGGGGSSQGGETEIESLKKIALFGGGIYVAEMDDEQTRGFTWTDKKSTRGLVTLDNLVVEGKEVGEIYCQLLDKEYKLKTKIKDGKPQAIIEIDALLAFEDRYKISNLFRYDKISEGVIDEALRKQFAASIKNELTLAVSKMKENECDAIGVKENLYRHHGKDYKDKNLSQVDFSVVPVEIKVKVRFK